MKGKILAFSIQKGGGLILGEDGQRYVFAASQWLEASLPNKDDVVDFEVNGQHAQSVYLLTNNPVATTNTSLPLHQINSRNSQPPSLLDLAITAVKQHYVNFNGRASRREFWAVMLFSVVISFALQLLYTLGFAISEALGWLLALPFFIFAFGMVLPQLAVSVRRLHDTNKSGWWLLIGLIPIVGTIALIVLFSQASTDGANQFGEPNHN